MKKIDAQKHINEILAFASGKIIEHKSVGSGAWYEDENPSFACNLEYRIRQEPKLVPFTFEDRELFKDKWIKLKGKAWLKRIVTIMTNNIVIFAVDKYEELDFIHISYEKLLSDYEFDDKTPCGKYINE